MLNLIGALKNSELPVITSNYTVLHFDEYPILFTGTNKFGNKIIGSFCDEDDDKNSLIYFIVIVSEKDYGYFYKKKLSYRDLILNTKEIFVLEKTFNNTIINSYLLPTSEIPTDYIPLENSFIPEKFIVAETLNYSFSLKGKLADLHRGLVNDINSMNLKIYDYLNEASKTLAVFGISSRILSQPSQVGSYRLNFDIDIIPNPQLAFFEAKKEKVTDFLNLYLNYISYKLPQEKNNFLNGNVDESENFSVVKDSFFEIFQSSNQEPDPKSADVLIDGINTTAEKLSDISEFLKSNESFDTLEVGVVDYKDQFFSNGIIDRDYKNIVETKLLYSESIANDIKVVTDETPKEYRILVFSINSESGKGLARLYTDSSENFSRIRLAINRNNKDLTHTIFTKSLNEDKVVTVSGIATIVDGIYKKLECYL
ncbi:hypothetical protein [Chryseobacterium luteum]|uniref:Uncharacterized protein n=1 Tax=Chryseobacterium luteum TaxID=421531 RepID=A0A085ZHG4_9FLAO|nr:hypothetical protein [Chryseobacterium luteum]KFF03878.1 hypothetical protein IX38_10765 [Chryseobacterium luteum]